MPAKMKLNKSEKEELRKLIKKEIINEGNWVTLSDKRWIRKLIRIMGKLGGGEK